jgi:hypothetical protein
MQEVLVDRGQFVLEDPDEMLDGVDIAAHGGLRLAVTRRAAADSSSLRGGRYRIKLVFEDLARARLACAAAGRDTGAGLQLLERANAGLSHRAVELFVGEPVADADVHGVALCRIVAGRQCKCKRFSIDSD